MITVHVWQTDKERKVIHGCFLDIDTDYEWDAVARAYRIFAVMPVFSEVDLEVDGKEYVDRERNIRLRVTKNHYEELKP